MQKTDGCLLFIIVKQTAFEVEVESVHLIDSGTRNFDEVDVLQAEIIILIRGSNNADSGKIG